MTKKTLKKRIRNARWRARKRAQLAHNWREPWMNVLVPNTPAYDDDVFTPARGWTPMKAPAPCTGCDRYTNCHAKE